MDKYVSCDHSHRSLNLIRDKHRQIISVRHSSTCGPHNLHPVFLLTFVRYQKTGCLII